MLDNFVKKTTLAAVLSVIIQGGAGADDSAGQESDTNPGSGNSFNSEMADIKKNIAKLSALMELRSLEAEFDRRFKSQEESGVANLSDEEGDSGESLFGSGQAGSSQDNGFSNLPLVVSVYGVGKSLKADIIYDSGYRYRGIQTGETLPSGHKVMKISPDKVLVRNKDGRARLAFASIGEMKVRAMIDSMSRSMQEQREQQRGMGQY